MRLKPSFPIQQTRHLNPSKKVLNPAMALSMLTVSIDERPALWVQKTQAS